MLLSTVTWTAYILYIQTILRLDFSEAIQLNFATFFPWVLPNSTLNLIFSSLITDFLTSTSVTLPVSELNCLITVISQIPFKQKSNKQLNIYEAILFGQGYNGGAQLEIKFTT